MKPVDTLTLLILSLLWGSAFLMNHLVVEGFDPLTVVAGRLALAGVALTLALRLTGRALPPRSAWPLLIVLGAFNNVAPFTLITWAQEHITSSLAATLVATMPLMTFILAVGVGSESGTVEKAGGVAIGFVGAAILLGPSLEDVTNSNTLGQLAVLLASACYAASTILSRERLRGEPIALAWGQVVFGAIIAVPLALAFEGAPDWGAPVKSWGALVSLALLSSALAYIIFFTLIQRVAATNVSIVSYLIPVVATLLGWVFLDEPIGARLALGLVLIVGGMMAVNGSLRAWLARAPADADAAPAG